MNAPEIDEGTRQAVLRHRFLIDRSWVTPEGLDDFLDLPDGTTRRVIEEQQAATE